MIKIGAKVVAHGRYVTFQLAEVTVPRDLFRIIVRLIDNMRLAYLDAWMGDMIGGLFHVENAICIHEEDTGILWKHWDFRTDKAEVRRARRLVISSPR